MTDPLKQIQAPIAYAISAAHTVSVRHHLPGYPGEAGREHGHAWTVRVWVVLDHPAAINLDDLEAWLWDFCGSWKGDALNRLCEMPTTEWAAGFVLQACAERFPAQRVEITDERGRIIRAER